MLQHSSQALRILGGVGLFFSFSEVSFNSPKLPPKLTVFPTQEPGSELSKLFKKNQGP